MSTAFNEGDPVDWPMRDGWHSGVIIGSAFAQLVDMDGSPTSAIGLRLTIREDQGRIITRDARGCAARIPGPHVTRAAA